VVECAESTTWHGRIHRIARLLVACCLLRPPARYKNNKDQIFIL
jgi:hypothetical protein